MSVACIGAAVVKGNGGFGVANVVEVNAVDVVVADDFTHNLGQVFGGAGHPGIEVPFVAGAGAEFRMTGGQGLSAEALGVGKRVGGEGHEIGVQLHAAAVGFVDGEAQHVVGRRYTGCAGESTVPRFDLRGVGHGGAQPRLKEHGVDAGGLQSVEDVRKACALVAGFGFGARIVVAGPVESAVGAEPHGANAARWGGVGGRWGLGCCKEGEENEKEGEEKAHGRDFGRSNGRLT